MTLKLIYYENIDLLKKQNQKKLLIRNLSLSIHLLSIYHHSIIIYIYQPVYLSIYLSICLPMQSRMDSIKKKMEKLATETMEAESRINHFEEIKVESRIYYSRKSRQSPEYTTLKRSQKTSSLVELFTRFFVVSQWLHILIVSWQ